VLRVMADKIRENGGIKQQGGEEVIVGRRKGKRGWGMRGG